MADILHDISWVIPLRNEFLTPIFEFFTWLGYPTFIMLMLPLGYWLWSKTVFTRVAVIVMLSTVLNAFLKDLWENPRPDLMFRLDADVGKSFGMPSGHAQVSAVLWFWLAYEIQRTWAWLIAIVVVGAICFSRIYLGIHDLEDILVGLAIALMSLFIFRFATLFKIQKLGRYGLKSQLLSILFVAILMKLIWPPASHSIGGLVAFSLLLAWILGSNLEAHYVSFSAKLEPLPRVFTGLIGVVGLFSLLAIITPLLSGLPSLTAGMIQSAILGIYMTLLAPLLFRLCRLSRT